MNTTTTPTEPASSLTIYLRLLGYVRPYFAQFAVSIVGFLIFAAAQPLLAAMLKYLIDGLADPHAKFVSDMPLLSNMELLYAVPFAIVLIAGFQGVGFYLGNFFLAQVSRGLIHDLRVALFKSLLVLPNHYLDNNASGHLISRITYNVTTVTGAGTEAIKILLREGLSVVFLLIYLLSINWKLTLVLLATMPIIGLMVNAAGRKFRRQSRKIQDAMGDVTHIASETIQGYRVVRSFGGEHYEAQRFVQASTENMEKQLRLVQTNAIYTPLLQVVTYSAVSVIMFLVLFNRGDASVGELVAYITAAGLLPKPIRQLSEISSTIQNGVAGAESIFQQLDEPPELDRGTVECASIKGRVEVRELNFSYPGTDKQVLTNINFNAEPGQMIALVGRSGSGKSTLASLIPRFYHHETGKVLIDGIDVEDYTLKSLRRHIALVTQQVTLFNDTIANNIAYGDLAGAPIADIEAAAEAAFAMEFIAKLPEGLNTVVGENGVLLSGGQRQRLAIARALLKNAPVLILDEATSALDTESERHIQAALDRAITGRTTVVIAHRLSTIERADQILVMDQGQIVERGRHAELLAAGGHYARLHDMQFSDDATAAND